MKIIKVISIIIQFILYGSAITLGIIWLFNIEVCFDPEAATFLLLTIVTPLLSYLVKKYSDIIAIEKFSTANALAYGYINNFIEPVLTELIKKSKKPVIYIYLPQTIDELYPKNVERIKANFIEKYGNIGTRSIKINEGRGARDLMTIASLGEDCFFDIPNTLLTLKPLIDYQVISPKNDLTDIEKEKLGVKYIDVFKQEILKLLSRKQLDKNIILIDKDFKIE
ncbi:STING domain-containing protein [Plebeiibacterium marinum]|uniref:Prokaryotic STING domain-containing protein n=1 Tax=Plebeiibacterium marinum TaxID=2992111 RepID=A0AAE3MIQ5_9BACT|nr:STING domain-containing protein [Plebeiobacterium marinum]MCW3808065.1 hypothetical protein [Plebeiobacterium marinum]